MSQNIRSYYIPPEVDEKLGATAERLGMSKSALLRELIQKEDRKMTTISKLAQADEIINDELQKLFAQNPDDWQDVRTAATKMFNERASVFGGTDHNGAPVSKSAAVEKMTKKPDELTDLLYRLTVDHEYGSLVRQTVGKEFLTGPGEMQDYLNKKDENVRLKGVLTRRNNRVIGLELENEKLNEDLELLKRHLSGYREANGGLAKDVERLKQAHKPALAATPNRAEVERLRAALSAAQDRIKALEAAAEADPDVDADMIMRAAEYLLAQRLNPARLALAIQQEVFSLRMQFADPKRLADGLSEAEVEQVIDGVNQRIVDAGIGAG